MSKFLSTENMSVGYNGNALIREICVSFRRGEIVTLIGPNGAGKSTILKSITKELRLIGGRVVLDGEDLQRLSYAQLSRKMAVVLTERIKPELMTCRDVVSAGRYPYTGRLGLLSAEDNLKVDEALRRVNALEIAGQSFDSISDGQRQRVMLARAICQEPQIMVLDEPTSFLDIRHKIELLTILRSMAKEQGIAVVMSLHEIDLAQKISDRVICVKGDRISKYGTLDEIFEEETIRNLFEIDTGSYDPTFGSIELPRPGGDTPEVFVLSSGGSGIPVYRRLQKEGRPFAAGILYPNDLDYAVAKRLACYVVTEKMFEPVSEAAIMEARRVMDACKEVIVTEFPIGTMNARVKALSE